MSVFEFSKWRAEGLRTVLQAKNIAIGDQLNDIIAEAQLAIEGAIHAWDIKATPPETKHNGEASETTGRDS